MLPRSLDSIEIRVVGALLEKAQTTPDYYPMTVNALIAACNQKSNREPVTSLTETEVYEALSALRQDVLVWNSDGARSEKWQENLTERLRLKGPARALMTVLLLRGPQTPGQLRARTGRMYPFESLDEIDGTLRDLAGLDEPLVAELPRQPGRKERRWTHLIGTDAPETTPAETTHAETAAPPTPPTPVPSERREAANPELESRVSKLEEEVRELRELLDSLTS